MGGGGGVKWLGVLGDWISANQSGSERLVVIKSSKKNFEDE
jgi:hypothetical protein